jgi:hypothetical protein
MQVKRFLTEGAVSDNFSEFQLQISILGKFQNLLRMASDCGFYGLIQHSNERHYYKASIGIVNRAEGQHYNPLALAKLEIYRV